MAQENSSLEGLLERQRVLESESFAEGAKRFRERLEMAQRRHTESTSPAARKLLRQGLLPMIRGLEFALSDTSARGRPAKALKWLQEVTPDVAAYLTLKSVLDGISESRIVARVAMGIAGLILDELKFRHFQATVGETQFQYVLNRFNTTSYEHMARSLRSQMTIRDIQAPQYDLSNTERMLLGMFCLNLLVETTGLVNVEHRYQKRRNARHRPRMQVFVTLTPESAIWITRRNEFLETLLPVYFPMIVPPLAWGRNVRGGYRYNLHGTQPLVRKISKEHEKRVDEAEMPVVYEAINRLQETPWCINRQILSVVKRIKTKGGDIAGLARCVELDPPPKPEDIAYNEESRKEWRKEAAKVKNLNRDLLIASIPMRKTLGMAERLKDEEAFFFPYNLDFRGRIYPIPNYLTPQGDDLQKALLLFAEPKALGETGAFWLAVHGANCLDTTPSGDKLTKMSFVDRVGYIKRHTVRIIATADDPWSDLWWTEADTPLQFLAFCLEWANYIRMGPEYACGLPVHMDGSCNGIQHFSALFRDEVGGATVNLIPSDQPADLYTRMSERTKDLLEEEAAAGNDLAALWLTSGLVGRKLVKRPTMTFGYGATLYGFKDQIITEIKKMGKWEEAVGHFGIEVRNPDSGSESFKVRRIYHATRNLGRTLWMALGDVVTKAVQGMNWFQDCAEILAKEGKPISWTVPMTGFPVRQEYFAAKKKQIKTKLAGKIFMPCVYDDTKKIERRKQSNSVSPNLIHSLDAAALMLTVSDAANHGLRCFSMIHDSYGTVPADVEQLQRMTRQAFYRLYMEVDVRDYLATQFAAQTESPLPTPPASGGLDLGGVLLSSYFFA